MSSSVMILRFLNSGMRPTSCAASGASAARNAAPGGLRGGMKSEPLRKQAAARACSGAAPSSFFSFSASPDMVRDA